MFTIIYSIEIILKIFGLGLFRSKSSFLRSGWNIMDALIVLLTILTSFIIEIDISFGSIRGFRFVNAVNNFKLKVMIGSIISAFSILMEAIFVLSIIGSFYAILGLQLFSNILKKRCFLSNFGIIQSENIFCGNIKCGENYFCGIYKNPDFESTNFDNFYSAFLQVFRIMTFNNWTYLMNIVQISLTNYIWIYFVSLGIIGNYILINLVLAVIKVKHSEHQQKRNDEISIREKKINISFEEAKVKIKKKIFLPGKKITIYCTKLAKKQNFLEVFQLIKEKNLNKKSFIPQIKIFLKDIIKFIKSKIYCFKKVKRGKKQKTYSKFGLIKSIKIKSLEKFKKLAKLENFPRYLICVVNHEKEYFSTSKGDVLPNWFL